MFGFVFFIRHSTVLNNPPKNCTLTSIYRNLVHPMVSAFSRKSRRVMLRPYLRMRPCCEPEHLKHGKCQKVNENTSAAAPGKRCPAAKISSRKQTGPTAADILRRCDNFALQALALPHEMRSGGRKASSPSGLVFDSTLTRTSEETLVGILY